MRLFFVVFENLSNSLHVLEQLKSIENEIKIMVK
jgi:hypothetical protein